jgi:hypothetical protein
MNDQRIVVAILLNTKFSYGAIIMPKDKGKKEIKKPKKAKEPKVQTPKTATNY